MDRRKFIKESCAACLSAAALTGVFASCQTTRYVSGSLGKDGLMINRDEFILKGNKKEQYRSFLIVRNEALQYPICIYRINENEYSALWMSCTHQGAELQASGDRLQCTAHGSEFTNTGKVSNGPADKDLRAFPVTINNDQLFIDLRAL
jgi:Rieske Fe-S protein